VLPIWALTIFGGSDVYVPQGIEVDMRGFALFGGADVRHVAAGSTASLRELVRESRRELRGSSKED
jgi:hypothetical protein